MRDENSAGTTPLPPEQQEPPAPPVLTIRIDRTTYRVGIHFSKTSTETMGDKIARLIENEKEDTPTPATNSMTTRVKPPPDEPVPKDGLTAGKGR